LVSAKDKVTHCPF